MIPTLDTVVTCLEDRNCNSTIVGLREDSLPEVLDLQALHVQKAHLVLGLILFTP